MSLLSKKFADFIWNLYVRMLPKEEEIIFSDSLQAFKKKIMDPKFDSSSCERNINPFFAKYGFKFSMLESEYYSICTGVKSDMYLPIMLYNKYIYPFLNPDAWRMGYCDKNMFTRLLNIKEAQKHIDILVPEYIVYCDNGRFFKPEDYLCSREEAIAIVCEYKEDFIIKPTLDSSHGNGVAKISHELVSPEFVSDLFKKYDSNFTIQKLIRQHPNLAEYNPTSVNTIRITTYQDFEGNVKVLYASQRFGGKGKVYDNADDPNGSGGFCPINSDGTVKREVHHYRNMKVTPLDPSISGVTPCYDKVVQAVLFLHTRFPQFGLIGWDMTVTPEGHPLVIEYNFFPGLGTGQLAHGPIFGEEDLRKIMSHIQKHGYSYVARQKVTFKKKPQNTILKKI